MVRYLGALGDGECILQVGAGYWQSSVLCHTDLPVGLLKGSHNTMAGFLGASDSRGKERVFGSYTPSLPQCQLVIKVSPIQSRSG